MKTLTIQISTAGESDGVKYITLVNERQIKEIKKEIDSLIRRPEYWDVEPKKFKVN